MKKLYIIIPSNRAVKLPQKTVNVIEQSRTPTIFVKQNLAPFYINHPYIIEIHTTKTGASNGRNIGIKHVMKHRGDIFAFTDDDCIITPSWIYSIRNFFNNPQHHLVQGQTKAYLPKKHPNMTCTCTFSKSNPNPIKTLDNLPDNSFGYSNNLAISRTLIKKLKQFNPQLGVGTPSLGGEDDDIFIRSLIHGEYIYYDKKMLLYHNKWLDNKELYKTYRNYTFSFACAFGIHAFNGNRDCQKILIKKIFKNIFISIKYLKYIFSPLRCFQLILENTIEITYFFRGLSHALFIKNNK